MDDGVTYYFVVRSVDQFGNESPDSEEVPRMLVGLEIDGPESVIENGTAEFTARARFKTGAVQLATSRPKLSMAAGESPGREKTSQKPPSGSRNSTRGWGTFPTWAAA